MLPRIYALVVVLFCTSTLLAEDKRTVPVYSIELHSSDEFTLAGRKTIAITMQSLKPEIRTIPNLKKVESIGIFHAGKIVLANNATPLNALRNIAVQLSSQLELEFSLVTDSTTSRSLQPHDLLMLYHPKIMMTLALTKVPDSEEHTLIGTYTTHFIQSIHAKR